MKKLLFLLTLIGSFVVNAQDTGTVSGLITDAKGMPLSGATVSIKILNKGAMTDFDGRYTIENVNVGTYNVAVSYIGYETNTKNILVTAGQTTQVDVSLKDSDTVLDEIILTANKKPQKITDVPATVNVITAREIEEFPSFNIGELAARQKGVDFVRSGVLGTGINIRGFNSAFNSKNLQVTDDRLSSLIATGLPLGSFSTVTKDDIERVEILLGPNGTLYGPNAHNGLVSTITKKPRTSEGTTFAIGAGNQSVLTARLRHAQVIDDKFAYKFHFERSQGTEYDYVDSVYVGTKAYKELELDRDFDSQKYGASLYYKPTKGSELIGYYGHSNTNNIGATNAGRNQIKDWSIDVAQVKFVSKNFFANTYYTWSKTDDTYAMNQRTQNYVSFIDNGFSEQEARERSYTEQWFPTGEGTGIVLPRGAVFKDASKRFNAEAQYNNNWDAFYLTLGAQYQLDMADSKGTYLLDDGGIDLAQTGIYTQLEYKLEDSGWGFLLGGRLDNHDLYGSNFIPKAAITKKVNNGTFRITYGKGIAVPSILNLKGNLFGGLVLGNGEGFTLKDGTKIAKLDVETINSYEIGYKGKISDKLFIDTNAYYNQSDNFISPLVNVAGTATGNFVTHVGDKPIGEVVQGSNGAFILTYLNFGYVDTYGLDVGLNYYFTDSFRAAFNYSYFDRDLDLTDMANDGNLDGKVLESELPINTPNHKFSLGFHYNQGKFYGSIFGRYVQKYDFFSGINIAAKTQDLDGDGVNEIVENARVGRTWNYGQLGGFTVDANAGYNFTDNLSLGMSITNLFNAEVREFVASPVINTLISFELKYKINFFKNQTVATN
ncbi:iron complex outermembrane receptor protein [Gelidibacter sediminis]|uniref:Iron complex outermembrane receptor protein n=1 Tax=Gelidibacter sediminis TaxID=1608710 RepID=A0A4R7PYK8_9FLAO|nr:TonB-dependent receptor [Gelidibacter sediminis]TDU40085.1 iron complex outermembrane receptor protein [Gelidibacter sediminis]